MLDANNSGQAGPVVAAPLRDQVYERLRSAILGGEIPAGERVSPPELAERLGVSTTPVREALRSLEEEGLIETSPRRWTRVASPSPELAAETYPVIATLEELAVASIETVTPDLLEELRAANRDFERAAADGDVFACMTANDAFHGALLRANGNGTLERTLRDLKTRIRLLDSQYFQSGTETSIREHEQVIDALERGDIEQAAGVIRGQWVRWLPAWGVSPAEH